MFKNDGKMNEIRLLQSNEISPIKIISHKNNTQIFSQSENTLLEVCDEELCDKENIDDLKQNSNLISTMQSKTSKCVKTKEVKSRYVTAKLVPKSSLIRGDNTLSPHDQTKPSSKKLKTQFSIKTVKPSIKTVNTVDSLQQEMDIEFSKYLQSVFVNSVYTAVINKQKEVFKDQFETYNTKLIDLTNEVNSLDRSISTLTLAKDLHRLIYEESTAIDLTLKSINDNRLKEFSEQMEFNTQLVEVDDDIDLGKIDQNIVSLIDDFVKIEVEDDGINVTKAFESLNELLGEVTKIVEEQGVESERFKVKCVNYVDDLLKNMKN